MAVDVLTEIVIDRSVDVVSQNAADPANAPSWYVNITAVRWQGEPRSDVGAWMTFTARFLGRELTYVHEITEFVPGARLVMRTAHGPFPMETTYTRENTESGATRMTLRNRGEPTGFASVTAPMMAVAMRRANNKDLTRLRDLLEARQAAIE